MCTAQELRRIAYNQRRLAALSDFPLIRDRHFAAAAQWDQLAKERDATETAHVV